MSDSTTTTPTTATEPKITTEPKDSKHALDTTSPNRPTKRAKTDNDDNDNDNNDKPPSSKNENDENNNDENNTPPPNPHITLSETHLTNSNYTATLTSTSALLTPLPPLPTISRAHLLRARALLAIALDQMHESGQPAPPSTFHEIRTALNTADQLNPDCEEVKEEQSKLMEFMGQLPYPEFEVETDVDVLIVGAGCAGVGVAVLLTQTFGLDVERVVLVERGEEVGESFRRWPEEMRFISPSFNQQGWTDSFDLNSVTYGTSPAYSLHCEHPSGKEYVKYLKALVEKNELRVRRGVEVEGVRPVGESGEGVPPLFEVDVRGVAGGEGKGETITTRFVIWAAGEFQYPKTYSSTPPSSSTAKPTVTEETTTNNNNNNNNDDDEEKKDDTTTTTTNSTTTTTTPNNNNKDPKDENTTSEPPDPNILPGASLCLHNSLVPSWSKLPGNDFIIIGGYESGVDACINLSRAGKRCTVLASTPCWHGKDNDPSTELAPYTAARLREVVTTVAAGGGGGGGGEGGGGIRPKLLAPLRVVRVEKAPSGGGFTVTAEWNEPEPTEEAPLREKYILSPSNTPPGEPGTTLTLHTPQPPILATGFTGSVSSTTQTPASTLFAFPPPGDPKRGCLGNAPLLTAEDESTIVPGVFLVGPQVKHDALSFCFVYKFRQRFGVVANAICTGLGMDTVAAVSECHQENMYLDSFETCGDKCGEVC